MSGTRKRIALIQYEGAKDRRKYEVLVKKSAYEMTCEKFPVKA